MSRTSSPQTARLLQGRISAAGEFAVLEQRFPQQANISLNNALNELAMQARLNELHQSVDQLIPLEEREPAPVLAFLGSMNGGKSSCVASHLSESGASRIPRGIGPRFGTHRFVFWLPKSWDDRTAESRLWDSIQAQLAGVFGPSIEFLSDDPAESFRQYNGGGDLSANFSLPLVAFDERLDELNLCLLDCPDIETGTDKQSAAQRLEMVEKAAGLIHGVVFVVESKDVRAESLNNLAGILGGVLSGRPRFLLLNFIRSSEGPIDERVADADVREMSNRLGTAKIFAAYDFEASSNKGLLPDDAAANVGLKFGVPWFFEVVGNSQGNEPSAIATERMLPEHLRKVEADSLWEQSISIKREELRRLLEHLQRDVSDECREQQTDLRATRETIIAFLRARLVDKEGDLNIPFTANLLRAIGDSFQRTVPIWARPALFVQGTVSAMAQEIKSRFDSATRAWRTMRNPGPEVSERVKEAGAKILGQRGENFFDASDFARLGKLHGIGMDASDEELTRAWSAILSVLQMGADTLPEAELDRVTLEIWKSIPIWKKVIFVASAPVLAVGGILTLCLALVDFGTTAVIFTAGVKGAIAIVGGAAVSTVGGTAALAKLDGLLKSHVAVPSYGRVMSAACDVFGVPRTFGEAQIETFPSLGKVDIDMELQPRLDPQIKMSTAILGASISKGWKNLIDTLNPTT